MRRTPAVLTAALITSGLAFGASGCGSEQAGSGGVTPSRTTPASTSASTTSVSPPTATGPSATPVAIEQTIVLTRTGGVGGLKDRLVVQPDGLYTVTTKGHQPVTRRLSDAQVAAIAQAVPKANLPAQQTQSPTDRRSDQFTYVIRVGSTTLTTTETTVPDDVRPLLTALGSLFSSPAPTP